MVKEINHARDNLQEATVYTQPYTICYLLRLASLFREDLDDCGTIVTRVTDCGTIVTRVTDCGTISPKDDCETIATTVTDCVTLVVEEKV